MRKALAALALAGSSVAFAEHKAFQEKYIIGCSTEQIATANSITDSFRTCAEELGHTFLPCILANLARAPSLLDGAERSLIGETERLDCPCRPDVDLMKGRLSSDELLSSAAALRQDRVLAEFVSGATVISRF